jgi:hypothetical protein
MAAHVEIVLDTSDADRLAEFWAAALGYQACSAASSSTARSLTRTVAVPS